MCLSNSPLGHSQLAPCIRFVCTHGFCVFFPHSGTHRNPLERRRYFLLWVPVCRPLPMRTTRVFPAGSGALLWCCVQGLSVSGLTSKGHSHHWLPFFKSVVVSLLPKQLKKYRDQGPGLVPRDSV